jgi:hypothetical protein
MSKKKNIFSKILVTLILIVLVVAMGLLGNSLWAPTNDEAGEDHVSAPAVNLEPGSPGETLPDITGEVHMQVNSDVESSSGNQVFAVGDSLMVGSVPYLSRYFPNFSYQAQVGISADTGIRFLKNLLEETQKKPDVLIVCLGTNNGLSMGQVNTIIDLADGAQIYWVNVALNYDYAYVGVSNACLNMAALQNRNFHIVDWASYIEDHPGFLYDGIHPSDYETYVDEIMARISD